MVLGELFRNETDQIDTNAESVHNSYWLGLATDIRRQWKLHLLLAVALAFVLVPVVLVIVMSTQTNREILDFTFLGIGSSGFENYRKVLVQEDFALFLRNSFIMALTVAIGKVIVSTMAAMAIVYYDFPLKRTLFVFILLTLLFPLPVLIVPMFELMVSLGWTNSFWALVVPYLASPTAILLLRQQYKSIPEPIVETTKLDGVGPLRFLVYVLLPMSKSMVVGLFAIMFIWSWNQYLWPLVVVSTTDRQVVQVGLNNLEGAMGAGEPLWGLIMAGTVLAMIVPLLVLLALYKPMLKTFSLQVK